MSEKAPAFQFYPGDWLSSFKIAEMSLEEEGAYIRLLCYCWSNGSIPSDPNRCAKIVGKGCSIDVATSVQRAFNICKVNRDLLVHKRLDDEREKQRKRREQQSEAGKKSGEKRKNARGSWESLVNERSTSVQQAFNSSSPSPPPSPLKKEKKSELLSDESFLSAWDLWHRHRIEKQKPLGEIEAEQQLFQLERFGAEEASKIVRFSISSGAMNLITNGDHKQPSRKRNESSNDKDLIVVGEYL